MRTSNHFKLAKKILNQSVCTLSFSQQLNFWIGNLEPDFNVFTYLHRSPGQAFFRGHNYENIIPVMKRMISRLEGKKVFTGNDYRILGKLFHYGCDCFTFPHNKEYSGTIKEHCDYEVELEQELKKKLTKKHLGFYLWAENHKQMILEEPKSLIDKITSLHQTYLRQYENVETDSSYILKVSELLLTLVPSDVMIVPCVKSKKEQLA